MLRSNKKVEECLGKNEQCSHQRLLSEVTRREGKKVKVCDVKEEERKTRGETERRVYMRSCDAEVEASKLNLRF